MKIQIYDNSAVEEEFSANSVNDLLSKLSSYLNEVATMQYNMAVITWAITVTNSAGMIQTSTITVKNGNKDELWSFSS